MTSRTLPAPDDTEDREASYHAARSLATPVAGRALRLGVLGPVQVSVASREVTPPQAKLRRLLAILIMRANKVVANDTLIQELWGEDPPPTALRALRVYVSQLRKFFAAYRVGADCQLVTQAPGYRLILAPGVLDLHLFERRCEQAREAAAARRPELAARHYRDALDLSRGPALADVRFGSLALESTALWLDEARLGVLMRRVDLELLLGHHLEMVSELTALTAEHRLNEGLHSRLMIALYRSGRTSDALGVYRSIRGMMIEELGTEPGVEIKRVHQAVLTSDRATLGHSGPWLA